MPAKILILQSDHQLSKNLASYLKLKGYETEAHSSPQNAISGADKLKPNLIITDLVLAGRSGVEFLYELRSYPDWQAIPVIAAGRLSQEELSVFQPAFGQLNITAYWHQSSGDLAQLIKQIERILQPVSV